MKRKQKKEEETPVSKKKVFIGVGHGGSDSGAVGYITEKDVNLQMALACRDFLTAYGVDVRMSRTKDEDDDINEEVRECNAYDPDLANCFRALNGLGQEVTLVFLPPGSYETWPEITPEQWEGRVEYGPSHVPIVLIPWESLPG